MPDITIDGKQYTPGSIEATNALGASAKNMGVTGQGVISATSLTNPVKPLTLPSVPTDTTNYNSLVAGGNAAISSLTPTATDPNAMPDYLKKYLEGTPPPNPTDTFNNLYIQSGIDERQQKVNESTNKINALNAQLQGMNAEQQAQSLQLKNEGISEGAIRTRNIALERENAIRALPIQAQILAENAVLTGNAALLTQAQQKFDQVFQLQTKYQTDLFNYNQRLRDVVYEYATKKEQRLLDEQAKKDEQAFTIFRDNQAIRADLAKTALENGQAGLAAQITQLDPKSPTYAQDLAKLQGQMRMKAEQPNIFGSETGGYYQQVYDPNTNSYKIKPVTGGGGIGGSINGVGGNKNDEVTGILNTILGSGKFTKDQTRAITNAISTGEDPLTVIRNQAKNIMGQTLATSLDKNEQTRDAMLQLQDSLTQFYLAGGDTGILKGNFEKVANKLGQVNDPGLVDIAVQISASLQKYRNAISGTAYSEQEGKDIASIFPGIDKGEVLNSTIIKARLKTINSDIDSAYKNTLGNGYEKLKNQYNATENNQDSVYTQTLESILNQQIQSSNSTSNNQGPGLLNSKGNTIIQGIGSAVGNLWNWLTGK